MGLGTSWQQPAGAMVSRTYEESSLVFLKCLLDIIYVKLYSKSIELYPTCHRLNLPDGDLEWARYQMDQLTIVGDRTVVLPRGVTAAEWALERNRYQNARIRTLLGAIGLLERVLDSNAAILNCSPARAREIWRRVREVAAIVEDRLAPLLRQTSPIPALDEARRAVAVALKQLHESTLVEITRRPEELPDRLVPEIRKLLCLLMGRLLAFLQDSFGALMGADPRSRHHRDYFLSKQFRRDVEEGEWLYQSVTELNDLVQAAARDNAAVLVPMIERLGAERWLPGPQSWQQISECLRRAEAAAGRLGVVLALHGIRFEELELLHEQSHELPLYCRSLEVLNRSAREAVAAIRSAAPDNRAGHEQAVQAMTACHESFSSQMLADGRKIHEVLTDLAAFLPIWLGNIRQRRSMLLNPEPDEELPALAPERDAVALRPLGPR